MYAIRKDLIAQGAHSNLDGDYGESIPGDLRILLELKEFQLSRPSVSVQGENLRQTNRVIERSLVGQQHPLGAGAQPLRTQTHPNLLVMPFANDTAGGQATSEEHGTSNTQDETAQSNNSNNRRRSTTQSRRRDGNTRNRLHAPRNDIAAPSAGSRSNLSTPGASRVTGLNNHLDMLAGSLSASRDMFRMAQFSSQRIQIHNRMDQIQRGLHTTSTTLLEAQLARNAALREGRDDDAAAIQSHISRMERSIQVSDASMGHLQQELEQFRDGEQAASTQPAAGNEEGQEEESDL